jgi:hypothetical protein
LSVRTAVLLVALLGVACTRVESTGTTKQAVATELAEVRFGATLTRSPWIPLGNHHPVARFSARGVDLGEAMAAALTPDGAVVVRANRVLERIEKRITIVSDDALPDIAVSNDGKLAYVTEQTGLHLVDARGDRRLVSAFADADRPLFLDDRTLLFVGAATPGVSSFYRLPLADEAPVALKSDGIPAHRDNYRVENLVVHFHDGVAEKTLELR